MTEAVIGGWLSASAISSAVSSGEIVISPFNDNNLNPNSYNYTLGNTILRLTSEEIDILVEDKFEMLEIPREGLLLMPGECYLGHTAEHFGSSKFASLVTGRSSIGRKFITNHVTAGLIDIGFFGEITLEITVQKPTRVYSDVSFGQIFWFTAVGALLTQYEGKYQGQSGPTPSKLSHNERS